MAVYELGSASEYHAQVRVAGSDELVCDVEGVTGLEWGRVRDDYSTAQVTMAKPRLGATCRRGLGAVGTWRHHLTLWREDDVVWHGPIVNKTERRDTLTLAARDMLAYLDRRGVKPQGSDSYFRPVPADTGALIRMLIQDGFAEHDPGLLAHAELRDSGTRSTLDHLWTDSATIGHVVRDLLHAGADLYTVGRTVYCVPDRTTGAPHQLCEEHFLGDIEVREAGLDAATRAVVVGAQPVGGDGQAVDGPPVRGAAGGVDPVLGLIERISGSESTTDSGVAEGIARAIVAYGCPPPVDLLVPSGARLSPTAPVDIGHLIPGAAFVVALDSYCTPVRAEFRLTELAVSWKPGETGESVAVSLASHGPPIPSEEQTT
ncbi:hypothetical protein GCM10010174_25730 [Kutzneria viridogrisea]|uniref:Uncharacterized protein n=1 Tax=Kutzneria viridogrisea TaxID=47990 RepID=A0ABR6BRT8_9PSEU|nr:hypothetical protein [Kutzneria viridogrisea]